MKSETFYGNTHTHTHTHCSLKLLSTIIYVSKSNPYKYSNTDGQHPQTNAQRREIRLRFKNVTISLVLQQTKHALTAHNLFTNSRVRSMCARVHLGQNPYFFLELNFQTTIALYVRVSVNN